MLLKIRNRFRALIGLEPIQFWQAGAIAGASSIALGYMTSAEARREVTALKSGPIVYVDLERAFIAFGSMPEAGTPQNNV